MYFIACVLGCVADPSVTTTKLQVTINWHLDSEVSLTKTALKINTENFKDKLKYKLLKTPKGTFSVISEL